MRLLNVMKHSFTRTPVLSVAVQAGKPKSIPAELTEMVDLNHFFVNGASALVRLEGQSMIEFGIDDGDWVMLALNKVPKDGQVVLARLNHDEYTVKRWEVRRHKLFLVPGNGSMAPREIKEEDNCEVVGVVCHIIKSV